MPATQPTPVARKRASCHGLTLIELMIVMTVMAIVGGIATPQALSALDAMRTGAAARLVATRARLARMEAVKRSAAVGLVFERVGTGYVFSCYVDTNGNGIRTVDIARRVDISISPPERLQDHFPGVEFGIADGVAPIEAGESINAGSDPIRLGRSNILTFTPGGSSSAGTLYIRGRSGRQYAVRVLGVTGRTRVLEFSRHSNTWLEH